MYNVHTNKSIGLSRDMKNPTHCLEALRHLASDTTLNATDRLLAAERAIDEYALQAGEPSSKRDKLAALNKAIASEPPAASDGHFWSALHDLISQRLRNVSTND
jgi:hypothetical protein